MNPYNAYLKKKNSGAELFNMVAESLEVAADHVRAAAEAIEKDDPMLRALESNKAGDILMRLSENLYTPSPELEDLVKTLNLYYVTMDRFISQMNAEKSPEMGKDIEDSLRQFAQYWRDLKERLTLEMVSQAG